jgi:uncharacterized protein (TIGR02757 family)
MADERLRAHLDALLHTQDVSARIQNDPIRLPHRYEQVEDIEISALLAAAYAYGKVDLFLGVLERIHTVMDDHGGTHAFVVNYEPATHGPLLAGMGYRWTRDTDLMWVIAALRHALCEHNTLAAVFAGSCAKTVLARAHDILLAAAVATAGKVGRNADAIADLPRGLKYFVPSPASGSGCKRGNLFLRWMVRSGDGVDLGVWTHLGPADLIMPIDRHVQRIAPLLGLVDRADGSWRTAHAVTTALAEYAPTDPVRYDFALAHTGISSGCRGVLDVPVCSACVIRTVCRHGRTLPDSETS